VYQNKLEGLLTVVLDFVKACFEGQSALISGLKGQLCCQPPPLKLLFKAEPEYCAWTKIWIGRCDPRKPNEELAVVKDELANCKDSLAAAEHKIEDLNEKLAAVEGELAQAKKELSRRDKGEGREE
jgi:hypothetical protein